jgi:hypothetical protein
MGNFIGLSSKNYEISPHQVKITFFTFLYIYIVLYDYIKLYIYYTYTYIYMKCKSQTIYTHNIRCEQQKLMGCE